jgi:hypothetical protein
MNAHIGKCDHGLSHPFKGLGAVSNAFTGFREELVVFLHFQLELNTVGPLNVPTDKHLKECGQHIVGLYL